MLSDRSKKLPSYVPKNFDMYNVVQEALLEAKSCLVSYSNTSSNFENPLQSLIQYLILIRDLI